MSNLLVFILYTNGKGAYLEIACIFLGILKFFFQEMFDIFCILCTNSPNSNILFLFLSITIDLKRKLIRENLTSNTGGGTSYKLQGCVSFCLFSEMVIIPRG